MGRRRTAVFIDGAPIASDCPGRGNRTRAERTIRKGRGIASATKPDEAPAPAGTAKPPAKMIPA